MAKTEKTETSTNGFFDVTKAFGDFRLPGFRFSRGRCGSSS
jgi:hypothetical protein